jgi:transposase-like protein
MRNMSDHLSYSKHELVGRYRGKSRNGRRSKRLLDPTSGDVADQHAPRRDGTFEPVIVKKRHGRAGCPMSIG